MTRQNHEPRDRDGQPSRRQQQGGLETPPQAQARADGPRGSDAGVLQDAAPPGGLYRGGYQQTQARQGGQGRGTVGGGAQDYRPGQSTHQGYGTPGGGYPGGRGGEAVAQHASQQASQPGRLGPQGGGRSGTGSSDTRHAGSGSSGTGSGTGARAQVQTSTGSLTGESGSTTSSNGTAGTPSAPGRSGST